MHNRKAICPQSEKSTDGGDKTIKKATIQQKSIKQEPNPKEIIQRVKMSPGSLTHNDVMQLQRTIGNKAVIQLLSKLKNSQKPKTEEEPIQLKKEGEEKAPSVGKDNKAMPDKLRSGLEKLSGISLSDVRVHKNSDKPQQVGALAYTQGSDIHVAPGQEKHIPHEGWHVVQQKQGRVKPTVQMKTGVQVNDDAGLEKEADIMGSRAAKEGSTVQMQKDSLLQHGQSDGRVIQLAAATDAGGATTADEQVISAVKLLEDILSAKAKYAEDEKGWRTLPLIGRNETDNQKQAKEDAKVARSKICESEEYKNDEVFKEAADEYLNKKNGGSGFGVFALKKIAEGAKTRIANKETGNLVTAAQLKELKWSDTSDSFVKKLNDALVKYGITDKESIRLFMATMAAESGWGKNTIEQGSDAYFAKKKYGKNGRGAGYIQITWRNTHLEFLKTMNDSFSDADTATYIANKYPMEASAWYWSKGAKTGEGNLNAYVTKNGGNLGVFLITQYYVNGFPTKDGKPIPGFADDLASIRKGGSFTINKDEKGKSASLSVNDHTYSLPKNWDDREDAYNKAIKTSDN